MRILMTAGPTREPIDAVRFISNRSSGRLGVALAQEAAEAGDSVTLLLGRGVDASQVAVVENAGPLLRIERFETVGDLQALLTKHFASCDLLIMAAAVADYRPLARSQGKLERRGRGERVTLELEPTPDLVAELAANRGEQQRIVAFALEEPDRLLERAQAKLQRKGVDAIVANALESMEGERIHAWWLTADGDREGPVHLSKPAFASWLLERARRLCRG